MIDWPTELKRYRKQLSLTQAALAETLNVDPTTISRWERGRDEPSLSVQRTLRKLIEPPPDIGRMALADIIDATGDIAVLMDREYRIVKASAAHRKLLGYDMTDIAGIRFPMWTAAMRATMDHIGGPEGWWTGGIRRMEFSIVRGQKELARNIEPIYQRVTTMTVQDTMGERYRYAITTVVPKTLYLPGPPRIERF